MSLEQLLSLTVVGAGREDERLLVECWSTRWMSGKKMMRNERRRLKQRSARMIAIRCCCWKEWNLIERHAIDHSSTTDDGEERST